MQHGYYGNGVDNGQYADGQRSGNYSDGNYSDGNKYVNIAGSMYPASIIVERRNETEDRRTVADRVSTANMKEMVDQSLREMLGMSMDDLKNKLGEIEQIKADIKAKSNQEEMRYCNLSH